MLSCLRWAILLISATQCRQINRLVTGCIIYVYSQHISDDKIRCGNDALPHLGLCVAPRPFVSLPACINYSCVLYHFIFCSIGKRQIDDIQVTSLIIQEWNILSPLANVSNPVCRDSNKKVMHCNM